MLTSIWKFYKLAIAPISWEQGSGKQLWNIDPNKLKGHLPAFLSDVPEIREDVADYLGECQAVDGGIGVLLEELEKLGELDNTLFVVSRILTLNFILTEHNII